ncbi:MAG TPA: zf-HC2 domain-containing protein [Blastocatellia bacterium]|nr:zf-HC2 domain-containing protein [Blastocatellia bacterium]
MTCDRISLQLEDLLDGELGQAERVAVEQHLAGCADCTNLYAALVREQQVYAGYDRGLDAGDDMWRAIAGRIDGETPGGQSWMARVAEWFRQLVAMPRFVPVAVAVGALVITGAVTLSVLRGSSSTPVEIISGGIQDEGVRPTPGAPVGGGTEAPKPPAATTQDPSKGSQPPDRKTVRTPRTVTPKPAVSALPATVVDAERDYLKAIAKLSKDVESERGSLDPVLRNKLERPLTAIDQNILTAREAVRKNPNDPTAVLNMFAAYDNKMDVLQQLARYQVAQNR